MCSFCCDCISVSLSQSGVFFFSNCFFQDCIGSFIYSSIFLSRSMQEPQAKRAQPAALEARVCTLALPTLGRILALTVGINDTVFVATISALYVICACASSL